MHKKNLLVVASLLLLATACKEDYPVVPASGSKTVEISNPERILAISTDDSVHATVGKDKFIKAKPEVIGSIHHGDITPEVVKD